MTSFFALRGASFFVHLRDKIFGHTFLTSLKNDFLSLNMTFIYLNSEIRSNGCMSLLMKVI